MVYFGGYRTVSGIGGNRTEAINTEKAISEEVD